MNVAFISDAYTRGLYNGLLQVTPIKCTDLPDEDSTVESMMSGGGSDAYLMVGVVEGKWAEDVKLLENEQFSNGVLDLQGCAHVGRSTTAWSNVDEAKARKNLQQGGSGAYHVPSSWGKGGTAVWQDDPPFYLYVQDPAQARLVLTVVDDNVMGEGDVIGSAHRKLEALLPAVKGGGLEAAMKEAALKKIKKQGGGGDLNAALSSALSEVQSLGQWEGEIKLTSKPRKKDKGGQVAAAAAAGALMAGVRAGRRARAVGPLHLGRGAGAVQLRCVPAARYFAGAAPSIRWTAIAR
ncbi:unnamed protein product [Heterosigma akashiwo]